MQNQKEESTAEAQRRRERTYGPIIIGSMAGSNPSNERPTYLPLPRGEGRGEGKGNVPTSATPRPYHVVTHATVFQVLDEVAAERVRQEAIHGAKCCSNPLLGLGRKMMILTEEVGEVGKAAYELEESRQSAYERSHADLRAELIQVAAVACAWAESLDRSKARAKS